MLVKLIFLAIQGILLLVSMALVGLWFEEIVRRRRR